MCSFWYGQWEIELFKNACSGIKYCGDLLTDVFMIAFKF